MFIKAGDNEIKEGLKAEEAREESIDRAALALLEMSQ